MKQIDLFEFLRNYPYWKTFKQQMYFIVNPIAHLRHIREEFKKLDNEDNVKADIVNNDKKS